MKSVRHAASNLGTTMLAQIYASAFTRVGAPPGLRMVASLLLAMRGEGSVTNSFVRQNQREAPMRNMTANNAFERTVNHRGRPVLAMDCVLARSQWRWWPAAQLGRLASMSVNVVGILDT